ncbi:MAG: hypothetical protein AAB584_02320 [Patescibacteria group bacterium]
MDKLAKKYKELFYRFSSHSDFEKKVETVRNRFGIDEDNPEKFLIRKLSLKEGEVWQDAIYDIVFAIIPKYMEAEGDFLFTATETYVIGGKNRVDDYLNGDVFYSYGMQLFKNLDAKHLSKFGDIYKKGLFIYISPYTSKSDLILAVNKKWPEIKNELQKKNINNKNLKGLLRVRSHTKKERDKMIFDLYNKSREELGLKRGEYKEIIVSLLLKKQGIDVQPENVKMIVLRQRKLRKGNI